MNPRALAAVVVELRKERDASAANEAAAAAPAADARPFNARPFNARPFTRPGGGAGPPGEPS